MRMVKESEYSLDCVINGIRVHPPFAYTNRECWFSHLKTIRHDKIDRLFSIIDRHNKCGTKYRFLSDYLYGIFLDNLPKWADKGFKE